jgi:NADPH-dependent 2,4-dienoyl-CoA reductase/sulfur reductase-like enzyme
MAKRVLIVGGVAGGANAATRLRRLDEKAEIIVFERGPYVSFANCGLPYHVGGEIQERKKLLQHTPETLKARFAIDGSVEIRAGLHPDPSKYYCNVEIFEPEMAQVLCD